MVRWRTCLAEETKQLSGWITRITTNNPNGSSSTNIDRPITRRNMQWNDKKAGKPSMTRITSKYRVSRDCVQCCLFFYVVFCSVFHRRMCKAVCAGGLRSRLPRTGSWHAEGYCSLHNRLENKTTAVEMEVFLSKFPFCGLWVTNTWHTLLTATVSRFARLRSSFARLRIERW